MESGRKEDGTTGKGSDSIGKDRKRVPAGVPLTDMLAFVQNDAAIRCHVYNFAMALSDSKDISHDESLRCLWDLTYSSKLSSGCEVTRIFNEKGHSIYRIDIRGKPDEKPHIYVSDELVAMGCLRISFSSTCDLARTLLVRGCVFRTRLEEPVPGSLPVEIPELGFRPVNYMPDLGDYAVYEERLRIFLRHRLTAVRALGGLYWRLANHFSDDGPSIESTLNEVSDTIPSALSEDDIALLCGQYKIYTGNLPRLQRLGLF